MVDPGKHDRHPIIPDDERKCVWMEEGLISFKICDRGMSCESCPLDQALRGSNAETVKKNLPDDSAISPVIEHLSRFKVDSSWHYHPGHTWIKVESPSRARVGLDDFVMTMLGSVDAVVLPKPDEKVVRNLSFGEIIQEERCFSIMSPLSGQVRAVNPELSDSPGMLAVNPMADGWLMVVEPASLEEDLRYCRTGMAVFSWYMKAMDWVNAGVSEALSGRLGALGRTFHDGGVMTRKLKDVLSQQKYLQLVVDLLGGQEEWTQTGKTRPASEGESGSEGG